MLSRQQRGRHHDGDLLAVERDRECRAQRHLGLAEADVAADQPVHRPAAFEVLQGGIDRAELVLGLLVGKARAELVIDMRLHRHFRRFVQMPLGGDLDQFAGDLADAVLELGFARLPAAAAEPVQLDIGVVGAVARQQFDILDRQKQLGLGGIMQLETVVRRAGDFERLQADETADAVLDMNHEIAAGKAGDLGDEIVELAAGLARPHQPVAEDVLLADDGDMVGLETGFHADHRQHGLVARRRLHRAPGVDAGEVAELVIARACCPCGRASLRSTARSPLSCAGPATPATCATTASNTLTEASVRSGAKLRPCRAPASTVSALPSGTANGVSRASAA